MMATMASLWTQLEGAVAHHVELRARQAALDQHRLARAHDDRARPIELAADALELVGTGEPFEGFDAAGSDERPALLPSSVVQVRHRAAGCLTRHGASAACGSHGATRATRPAEADSRPRVAQMTEAREHVGLVCVLEDDRRAGGARHGERRRDVDDAGSQRPMQVAGRGGPGCRAGARAAVPRCGSVSQALSVPVMAA